MPVSWFWLLLAAAGLLALAAVGQLVTKNKQGAAVAGGLGVVAVGAAFSFKEKIWDMSPIPIYSYGVMLGLSLVVGWYLTLGLAERDGMPKETMANCYIVTAIAAVVGSRILYILTNWGEFANDLPSMFAMRRGGLVAYGGFLGGFVGSLVFLRQYGFRLMPWADWAVPSLASGLMITRIGCYMFGCDFGKRLSDAAPAFLQKLGSFPHWAAGTLDGGDGAPAWSWHVKKYGLPQSADYSLPVHPTQLYESLVGASLLVLLLVSRRYQKFRGQIFFIFTFAYGVCRFLLELLRDDAERGSIPPSLPVHILYPGALMLFAVGYLVGFSRMITHKVVQRVTQVAAFVPGILLYFDMRPESYGTSVTEQLSTSQAVALGTGLAVSLAFSFYYKAALAHPETAMDLGLPREDKEADTSLDADADEDEDDDGATKRPAQKPRAADKPTAPKADAEGTDIPKKTGTKKAKLKTGVKKKKAATTPSETLREGTPPGEEKPADDASTEKTEDSPEER
jgi:phosphatidylglycerol:prolipoprotein diacylglycerol transferase